ncbi:MAG TPA: Crp/Fnr family transcriptional regulator [Actinomycetota bacterium]|nr:Crp/Fnr family transcriptional regulator [Actinomycetota bacterium]
MAATDPVASGNRLIDSLPQSDRDALLALAKQVTLETGEVLAEADEPLRYAYFPRNGMVSIVTVVEDGTMVESGTIGNEGMFGIQIVLGAESSPNLRALAQIRTDAMRVEADEFRSLALNASTLQSRLLRYSHVLLVQAAQAVLCNRRHSAEQRCAKWLLFAQDRMGTDRIDLTQEFLSQVLGVRRASVTTVANALRKQGFIAYHRGSITILDRAGLESASCGCYAMIRQEYDRFLKATGVSANG